MHSKWILVAVFVVAIVLRVVGLDHQSFSMDECLELETAEMTIDQIVWAPNSFPPLYHLLLKAWLTVETSPIAARTFSLLTSLISVWLTWKLAREAANEQVALIVAAIVATSPFHIYYSQQGRGYMLLILLASVSMYIGMRLMREPTTRDRMLFVLAGVAGGYTHYYFAVVLVAIGIGILLHNGTRFFVKQIFPLAVIIGLLCSPLFGLMSDDLGYQTRLRENRRPSLAAVGYTVFSYISGYTLGPSRAELHSQGQSEAIREALPWLGIVLFATGLPLFLGFFGLREWKYWCSVFCLPFLIVIVLCFALGVTYNTRFLVYCWVPFCILLAAGMEECLPRPKIAMLITLIAVSMLAIYNRQRVDRYQNEDVRAAAEFIASQSEKPVVTCAGYMFRPLRRYSINPDLVDRLMDRGYPNGGDELALETIDEQNQDYWLVYSRAYHGDPDGVILKAAMVNAAAEGPVFVAPGVKVYDIRP